MHHCLPGSIGRGNDSIARSADTDFIIIARLDLVIR
jgi:hypothetical protein